MAARNVRSLLTPNDPRWARINARQDADRAARAAAMTVAERLDRGVRLSRAAAELRRAAWEAASGPPAA